MSCLPLSCTCPPAGNVLRGGFFSGELWLLLGPGQSLPPQGPGLRSCKQPSHDSGSPGAARAVPCRAVPGSWSPALPFPPYLLHPMDFNKEIINPSVWAVWRWAAAIPGALVGAAGVGTPVGSVGRGTRGWGQRGVRAPARARRAPRVPGRARGRAHLSGGRVLRGRGPRGENCLNTDRGVAQAWGGVARAVPSRRFKFEARAFPPEFVCPPR